MVFTNSYDDKILVSLLHQICELARNNGWKIKEKEVHEKQISLTSNFTRLIEVLPMDSLINVI